jgi:inosose dehydratase
MAVSVRIGTNPIAWSNDDMQHLGGETPLETCLAEAKQAGFEGMELGNKFPRDAAALTAALAPFGLACVSGWYSAELLLREAEDEFAAARAHVGLLKAMGADVVVVAETSNAIHTQIAVPLSRRPELDDGGWALFGRRLTALGDLMAQDGMRLAYHHHMGTVVQSEADIHRLMSETGPSVHLLLDTGHASWGGADPARLAERYRHRIAHVHAKDVRAEIRQKADAEDWSFLNSVLAGVYTVPGDGSVDFDTVFRELPDYAGWVVVEAEQDPAKAHPLTYAKLGYATLRGVLERAGLIGGRAR